MCYNAGMDGIVIRPITPDQARAAVAWRYAPPYDIYNTPLDDIDGEVAYLVDPANRVHAIATAAGELIGYCSFGTDAQVPGGDYSADALDVGVGMRPDLTGHGHGSRYLEAVFRYATDQFAPTALRATVAAFNERAQRAVLACGFTRSAEFIGETDRPRPFVVFVRPVDR